MKRQAKMLSCSTLRSKPPLLLDVIVGRPIYVRVRLQARLSIAVKDESGRFASQKRRDVCCPSPDSGWAGGGSPVVRWTAFLSQYETPVALPAGPRGHTTNPRYEGFIPSGWCFLERTNAIRQSHEVLLRLELLHSGLEDLKHCHFLQQGNACQIITLVLY